MKKNFSFRNVLIVVLTMSLLSLIGCSSQEPVEKTVGHEQNDKPIFRVPIPAEVSSIVIDESFDTILYDADDIKHIFFDMFPEYITYHSEITITPILSEDVLPYFEGLYLATCTQSEAYTWENTHFLMPSICMYLVNLPSSLGYALINPDKRTPYSLILFRENMNLSPNAFSYMYDLSLQMLDYLWYGDLDDYLDMNENVRQLANGLDLEPNPDWWSNWKAGVTNYLDEFAVDMNTCSGGGASPTVDIIAPYYITSNGIKNWTDVFPANFSADKTGTLPLSIVKTMAYHQYVGPIPNYVNVDWSNYITLTSPARPDDAILAIGIYLNSHYTNATPSILSHTKTRVDSALLYLGSIYGIYETNYSLLNTYSDLSDALDAHSSKVVIYELQGEWYIVQGIKTCTYPGTGPSNPMGVMTWYYKIDNHSGKPIYRRIYGGKIYII